MKKLFYLGASLIALSLSVSSCGTVAQTTATSSANALTEQVLPLSGPQYRTDATYYRAVQSGKSKDMSTAKKVALQNARQELAASIKADLRMVIENYTNNRQLPTDEVSTTTTQMTELAYTVVNERLMGSSLSDEKLFTTAAGEYQYFVCVELNKNELKQALVDEMKRNEKMVSEAEISDFRKIFDEQMAKSQIK
jgi:hypothetical protein